MRRTFAKELHKQMAKDKRIWVLTGDLGYGWFEDIQKDYPSRFINCGVAEQNMIGVACGLAACGKIPFVYSIASFLLYRGFEFIRNDVDHDRANVKLVGCGRKDEYDLDGFTHWCFDDTLLTARVFKNIRPDWPHTKGEIKRVVKRAIKEHGPFYISLSRFGCKEEK